MKNKLRNITVKEQFFVYWYLSGKNFVLNISPKDDKTTKITLIFTPKAPKDDPVMFWAFYEIQGLKDNTETTICLAKPKGIAEMIAFLLNNKKELFIKGQTSIIKNAMDLLNEMGYSNLKPMWVPEW